LPALVEEERYGEPVAIGELIKNTGFQGMGDG
jgi:hypothetical protein